MKTKTMEFKLEKNDRIITNEDFERLTTLKEINEETIRDMVDEVIGEERSFVIELRRQINEFIYENLKTFNYNTYRRVEDYRREFDEINGIFENYRRERAELIAEYVEYHKLKKKRFWRWVFKIFG